MIYTSVSSALFPWPVFRSIVGKPRDRVVVFNHAWNRKPPSLPLTWPCGAITGRLTKTKNKNRQNLRQIFHKVFFIQGHGGYFHKFLHKLNQKKKKTSQTSFFFFSKLHVSIHYTHRIRFPIFLTETYSKF